MRTFTNMGGVPFATALNSELDELLVEGFLLQVTLPETEQLHRYLLYKLAPPPHTSPGGNSPERDQQQQSQRKSPQHGKVKIFTAKIRIYLTDLLMKLTFKFNQCRMAFPVSQRKHWMLRANGPKNGRTALTLSSATKLRSLAKRNLRKAEKDLKTTERALLQLTQGLIEHHQTRRKITHYVQHRGAGSQKETRFVLISVSFTQATLS